mmetsp:Transcript_21094/g.40986  ORF Transcript_21094/g.40986 Transcript_21094/m.40986 type:complete len:195 (+) Transcript_21094:242-826(+)|eukprot:CAMPEP_0173393848 /NCGR_PEP_ID=MMETSP1356-20130122/22346_1 /TAXON_ID=77927 ORGANISM="Hemiselmis virescens, Strain PCC157" /NCGR_SAMPLE_ID=MMETSP1356 /ASSEMBLY_ACC=CAM_ASM_000847 /LENGTH=194 /DNA_ID=CAMNT_0014351933 /DNA_START=240 /DNA_END=824 /DNA_ORIENTATION=-
MSSQMSEGPVYDPDVMMAIGQLHGACHRGSGADVRRLLEEGEDINEKANSGLTPLMCAVQTIGPKPGDDQLVQLLLDNNAEVNAVDVLGDSALHYAAAQVESLNELLPKGFDNMVDMLIKGNADVNLVDKLGQTPLHRAALRGNTKTIKLLMDAGADTEVVDRSGRTPADCVFHVSLLPLLERPKEPEAAEEEA